MRIILSAAISVDGYLDDRNEERLILSSPEDWREVYALRGQFDAILVGAETLRRDNPSLTLKNEAVRARRVAEGRTADIMKVTVSASADLPPELRFFTEGEGQKVVFTTANVPVELSERATVISRPEITPAIIVAQLRAIGVRSLMVEGGRQILSMFLAERYWDEFRLAVAPIFVGDGGGTRLVLDGEYAPMTLVSSEKLGQTTVMTFENRALHRVDCHNLARTVVISERSPVVEERYRVGALLVTADGREFEGYTGETGPRNHAEQEAITKALAAGADPRSATLYTSIEPCTSRATPCESCTELIISHGIARVIFGLREPDHFVRCQGVEALENAGIEVVEKPIYASEILDINRHLLG